MFKIFVSPPELLLRVRLPRSIPWFLAGSIWAGLAEPAAWVPYLQLAPRCLAERHCGPPWIGPPLALLTGRQEETEETNCPRPECHLAGEQPGKMFSCPGYLGVSHH